MIQDIGGTRPAVAVGGLSWRETFAAYHELTKPGITLMVVVSAAAGFWLALPRNTELVLTMDYAMRFLVTLVGTALVSAGSCTLNHVLERGYDLRMKRTMDRPIPSGRIAPAHAAFFGMLLSAVGLGLLAAHSVLAAALAAATWFLYLGVYTPLKRRTSLATLVGGIPGALPPLGGWVMGSGSIEAGGLVLFLVLFVWQMPHFLSLAWMYRKDYERGGFQMLTVQDERGVRVGLHVLAYTAALVVFSLSLTPMGETGPWYFAVTFVLGAAFLVASARFLAERSNTRARTVLLSSYMYLLAVLTMMFIDKV